ncbi:AAA family ATPase [Clostridium sp. 19966]|uniref:RNA polymerase recycling motor HelD n=1 Tax=Clostridium sp. 19966 TaxID=2768166 RepID=UPI0028DF29EE|nr:RNA polymerase recycling motor HelD [Clostridium sp. 19966]MDT8718974.1 AAA family ATPase [Clostridium sp. 19966]
MSAKDHPQYEEEKERLDYTVDYIDKTLKATETFRRVYKGNVQQAMEGFDPEDASMGFVSMLVSEKLIHAAEKNYYNYQKAKAKPYFARIDFKRKDEDKINQLYIGKTSVMKAEDNEPLIVDWRAPVATLYYEGRLGDTSYEAEEGLQEGELLLKRQFTINEGELEKIFDIDITTNDELLQEALEAGAESRLKDIASTIQAEQNRIIRAPMYKPLIVQGVAGSGKTTIALHRIAYFIYNYEKTFDPENFLIIAPNSLFINYISEVLPELGVERVQQSTFMDFMNLLLGKKLKLKEDDKLMEIIHNRDNEDTDFMKWAAGFKGSMEFKDIIQSYIEDIEKNYIPEVDFKVGGKLLMKAGEIKRRFSEDLTVHPFQKRIEEIKKSFKGKLKLVQDNMFKALQDYYYESMEEVRRTVFDTEEKSRLITEIAKERDESLAKLTNDFNNAIKNYTSKCPQKTVEDYYIELITNPSKMQKYSKKKLAKDKLQYLADTAKELFKEDKYELEDYAGLVYLKAKIFGFDKKIKINSAVVDEAQDFSLFQIFTLKTVLNTGMITLLGDLSQGIHAYRGIDNWQEVLNKVFAEDECSYMTLEQSYRTTVEVMELANNIISKLGKEGIILAKPVIRHGEKPDIEEFKDKNELIETLEENLLAMKNAGYKSNAIICKTQKECEKVKRALDKRGNVKCKILSEKQRQYEAGIIIVPSHAAKGLEFDTVFIVNMDESYIQDELDIKLLYVAMTRTMHRLFVYHMENTIPILKDKISFKKMEINNTVRL